MAFAPRRKDIWLAASSYVAELLFANAHVDLMRSLLPGEAPVDYALNF